MIWDDLGWGLRQPRFLSVLNLRSFQRKKGHLLVVAGILPISRKMTLGTIL